MESFLAALGALGAIVIVVPLSVIPGDDDLVVIPVFDVSEVGHDGHLELVGLPIVSELLLDRVTGDDYLAEALDPDQSRQVPDGAVGIGLLDGLDDGPVLLALLDVDADEALCCRGGHTWFSFRGTPSVWKKARMFAADSLTDAAPPAATSWSALAATESAASVAPASADSTISASSALLVSPSSGSEVHARYSASSQRRWSLNHLERCCAIRLYEPAPPLRAASSR